MSNISLLLLSARPETRFWAGIVFLLIAALAYLANKLTRGYTIGYTQCKINERVKAILMGVHGFGSLILALMLPNNYLNEIEFVGKLYEENELWIATSILLLLFTFIILFGTVFTLAARLFGADKTRS
jgi:hypothetical protein